MAAAADAEDMIEKHVITPGPLAPARELYGEMLLERGMAKEALDRLRSHQSEGAESFPRLLGAAQAAVKLGDNGVAKANYEKLSQRHPARTPSDRSSPLLVSPSPN